MLESGRMGWLLCSIKAVVGWGVLLFVGMNLIGMIVGGLAHPFWRYRPPSDDPFLKKLATRNKRGMVASTLFFGLLTVVYLALLLRFFNVGVLAAAVLLMFSRLPDQLWEIRAGQLLTLAENPPKSGALHTLAQAGMLVALPLLWFSLC